MIKIIYLSQGKVHGAKLNLIKKKGFEFGEKEYLEISEYCKKIK